MPIHPFTQALICIWLLLYSAFATHAQPKKNNVAVPSPPTTTIIDFELTEHGDTINRIDALKRRQGTWLLFTPSHYGEAGYYEYGSFTNDLKQGLWISYDEQGRKLATENYKNGLRHGEASYYDEGKLYCAGQYLALRSQYEYDTIQVEDPISNTFKPVVIKSNRGSVRHGYWTYYNTSTRQVERVQEYQADEIIYDKEYKEKVDSIAIQQKMKTWPHVGKHELPNVWFLDKNKKPVRFTDLPADGKGIKPNVRKSPTPARK